MIKRWCQIKCDHCFFSEFYLGAQYEIPEQAKKDGWVFKQKNDSSEIKHYCQEACFMDFKDQQALRNEEDELSTELSEESQEFVLEVI